MTCSATVSRIKVQRSDLSDAILEDRVVDCRPVYFFTLICTLMILIIDDCTSLTGNKSIPCLCGVNNGFRQIFGYRRSESVKDVIYGLGRVNFKCLLLLRTVKFYKRLYLKSGLLHDVFWSFMIFNCDDCMRTVFIPLHKAICCASSTTMCLVMPNLYLSVYICISLSGSA